MINETQPNAKRTVDIGSNPFDLAPLISAVMEEESRILSNLPADKKLVILLGEIHMQRNHTLLQHAIIAAHLDQFKKDDRNSFALGFEIQHDFRRSFGRALKNHKKYVHEHSLSFDEIFENAKNPDNRMGLEASIIFHELEGRDGYHPYLLKNNISTSFNDYSAKWVNREYIADKEDDFTRELIKRYRPQLAEENIQRIVSRGSDFNDWPLDGLALSNLAIVDNAIAHMERAGNRIYLQQCGAMHIFTPDQENLTSLFQQRGFHVLPVMPDDIAPALPDVPKTIIVENLDRMNEKMKDLEYREASRQVGEALGLAL